jgi:hypothetical protein
VELDGRGGARREQVGARDLDRKATEGTTGWSGGGAGDGKHLAEDKDEVREEEQMHACICELLEDDAPKHVGPTPGTV